MMHHLPVSIRLLYGDILEMRELQRVMEEAPTYAHRVTGLPPGKADAQSTFTVLPEGKSYDDKFVFGIYRGGEMVGCVDLIRGYPNTSTAFLGLLLISERHQRSGIGSQAYHLIENFIREWKSCAVVRLGVLRTNSEVLSFWKRMGFMETGELKPYRYGVIVSDIILMEKKLQRFLL